VNVSLAARPAATGVSEVPVARLLALLLPTALSLYANFNGFQSIVTPKLIEAIDPAHKIERLAELTTICAVTGVLGLSLGGAFSDASFGRYGRRAPWLAGMALLSAGLALGLSGQTTLLGVNAICGALWFTLNFYQAAMLAATPDRVPDTKRALASSVVGVSGPLGAVFGVNLAAVLPLGIGAAALVVCLLVTTALFLVFAREKPFAQRPRAAGGRRRSLNLFRSFGHRDFALAYVFRVLMFLGQYSINNYLFYILQDHIGAANPGVASGQISALRTTATLATVGLALWCANRTHKRKIFAQSYALIMAPAMLIPVALPSWTGMLAFAALSGVASGVYSAIDLPLMSKVLPAPESAGRDLALLVMAGASAQFLAPWIGGGLIAHFGYETLFIVSAFITLLCGLTISMIRRAP
jgi:MFS family permease